MADKYVAVLSGHSIFELENTIQNVFAYEADAGSPSAADLGAAIGTSLVSVLAPVISGNFQWDTVVTLNLDDLSDFATTIVGTNGSAGGESMPSFVTWEFEYFRATREVNNGRKSFGLVPEAMVENGVATAAAEALLDDVADFLSDDLAGVAPATNYIPRIWRRAGTYAAGVFPDTFYPITAVGYKRVSTQNTRKR